nr:GTPase [Lachnospiraceae bacterium]
MGAVYFINGFLDAGKTTFIKDMISRETFKIPGKTLLFLCEQGEEEYDKELLAHTNTFVEVVENEEDFNGEYLSALEEKHKPERIIVEFNGMWDRKNLLFPRQWEDILEIAIFDSTTFKLFADNLRSVLAEQVRRAEIIVFYRADEVRDKLASYARNIKAINSGAALLFHGAKGDITLDSNERLPYDINKEKLELTDVDFAVMCMDSMERVDAYKGKKVHFTARAY